jgi:glycosyltransferase involved in cell wall biosynthesis
MKVLHVISSAGYYGAEAMVVNLCLGLREMGVSCTLAVFQNRHMPDCQLADVAAGRGIEVRGIECNGRLDWKAVQSLSAMARELRVDFIHAHGYKAHVYALLAARRRFAALVGTYHGYQSHVGRQGLQAALRQRLYGVANRVALRYYERVLVPSPMLARMLEAGGVAAEKLGVVPNGVEVGAFHGATPASDIRERKKGGFAIGLIARLVPGKGHHELLHALRTVLTRHPKTLVLFVGEGPMRAELEVEAARIGVAENVVFTGARRDMASVYTALDTVVLPSHAEGLPMALLEAMSASCPVIATPVGAVPALILDGRTGLLVAAGEVDDLAKSILRMIEEPGLRAGLAHRGHEHVGMQFSSGAMAAQYIRAYEGVRHA